MSISLSTAAAADSADQNEATKKLLELKEAGNQAFAAKELDRAVDCYTQALGIAPATQTMHVMQLYSNRAHVYIQQHAYEAAVADCDAVLMSEHPNNNRNANKVMAKVWYRRCVAREGLSSTQNNPIQSKVLLLQAKSDLQECSKLTNSTGMKQTIAATAVRLARTLQRVQQQVQAADQHATYQTTTSRSMQSTDHDSKQRQKQSQPISPAVPSPGQQLRDVLELLENRSLNANNLPGEAMILVDWDWWCDWCRYVGFTSSQLLPLGHVDMDSDDVDDDAPVPPGAMNHDMLLLDNNHDTTQGRFYQHWYSAYRCANENVAASQGDISPFVALRPGLVRGYHYELLPREVYHALSSWYSCAYPPILRRADESGHISLYPLHFNSTVTKRSRRCETCGAPGATQRCGSCAQTYYCHRSCQNMHWKIHKPHCRKAARKENGSTADENTVRQNTTTNRGRTPQPRRCVGLNNIGNTCFLNSTLQALTATEPLRRYFLSCDFKQDLNATNALGTGGRLALAYESVVRSLSSTTHPFSFSPVALKRAIAQFAPRFAGCLQHDAQEFLAYLLDGLHEDLNRIHDHPYAALPDANGDMGIAGARAWGAHLRRNDSLVLDTFYGQFKSTCVCPKCNRISVSFDAFNHVSLGMHQDKSSSVTVMLFRVGHQPLRCTLELSPSHRVGDLKLALKFSGVPTKRLVLCEVIDHAIEKMFPNNLPMASVVRSQGYLAVYEVDPLTGNGQALRETFHAVISQKLLDGSQEFAIGYPFLTSFPASFTCRQAWKHLWDIVKVFVDSDDEAILHVSVVNQNGYPQSAFSNKNNNPQDEEGGKTSILPSDSDTLLVMVLGENATSNFLFLHLIWTDDSPLGENSGTGSRLIDEERFLQFKNHVSYIEAMKKNEAKGAKKGMTLDQCFEAFTQPERLDEHNMWFCSSCNERVCAMKTMELWKLPNVLIVHLKRFEFKNAFRRDKIDTFVDFPLEGFDAKAHCPALNVGEKGFMDDEVPSVYDCFAVVNHFGRMGFGHYTNFARDWNESGTFGEWRLCDDATVRSVSPQAVVSPAAYVIFYRRRTFH